MKLINWGRAAVATASALVLLGAGLADATGVPYGISPGPGADVGTVRGMSQPVATSDSYVPVTRQFKQWGVDRASGAPHNAFPLMTKLDDGRVRAMWRASSGHLDKDGRIMSTVGDPRTGEWEPPVELVLDTASPARDMRPGALSTVDGAVWLTYFFWEAGVPAGAYVTKSTDGGATFGPSVRVDGGKPWVAVSAPLVKWQGQLVVPWYGKQAGESYDTVWMSLSADGGQTWTANRYVNALGAQKHTQEPWAVVRGNKLIILYRDGTWSNLAMRESPDTGTTWPSTRVIATNATGNSGAVWASNGAIYVIYRHTQTRDAMLLVSKDLGATWQVDPTPLLRVPANLGPQSLGMVYGTPVDLGDGKVYAQVGMEASLDEAAIMEGWL